MRVTSGRATRPENGADVLGLLFAVTLSIASQVAEVRWRDNVRKLALKGSPRCPRRLASLARRAPLLAISGMGRVVEAMNPAETVPDFRQPLASL